MQLPRGYLSYNQISLYQLCPRKYRFCYIDEVPAEINDKIFLGIVFHSVVETVLDKKIHGEILGNDEVIDLFHRCFDDLQSENQVVWQTRRETVRKRGQWLIDYFSQSMAPAITPLMVERELQVTLPESGLALKGIIDLVEEDFSLTDFKTTRSRWSKQRTRRASLQMVIYKYLFEESFENSSPSQRFRILYGSSPSTIRHQEIMLNREDIDLQEMIRVVHYVADGISRGVFYKNEGYQCNWCDYRDICLR